MDPSRRSVLVATAAGVASTLAGCSDVAGGLFEDDFDVGMSANAFLPERHETTVGETVVWENNGSRGHTVTAYDAALPEGAAFFASGGYEDTESAREDWHATGGGNIRPGERFEHTFETPGDHGYFCIPHEAKGMTGVVVVRE